MLTMRQILWPAVCVQVLCACFVARVEGAAPAVSATQPVLTRAVVADRPLTDLRPRVAVRVYSPATVEVETLQGALDLAAKTFLEASLDVVWTVCRIACATPPAPGELLVRFANAPAGARQDERCLGDAVIDVQKHIGVLATVYLDRVVRLAHALGLEESALLGRTLAHEMGHLLLASNRHGEGLMREVWSTRELQGARADDWTLRSADVVVIRQHVAQAGAATPAPAS